MCLQMCGIAANNSLILGGAYVSFEPECNEFSIQLRSRHAWLRQHRIPRLASLTSTCWNRTASLRDRLSPKRPRTSAKMKARQLSSLLTRSTSMPAHPHPVFPPSSPFPKHEHFTANSIFPQLGSHGTALEFRFVMIKWLHGIVFLRAPPSAFIRICQCRCRSASQSARLHRSSSPPRAPLPQTGYSLWKTSLLADA